MRSFLDIIKQKENEYKIEDRLLYRRERIYKLR
jgi:hypothetical protein